MRNSSPPPLFLGIDPGASGGMVALQGSRVEATALGNMTEVQVWEWLQLHDAAKFAVIEFIPTAIFGTGKSSMSKLYGSYMALRMALAGNGIRREAVEAKVWQPAVGLCRKPKGASQTKWKNMLKQRAQELFPRVKVTLAISDALLIAEYARRTYGNP